VRIYEDEDGHVSIRIDDVELPARGFVKDGLPSPQGQVVPNMRLAHALDTIRERQAARERQRLEIAKTRRQCRLIRDKLRADALN